MKLDVPFYEQDRLNCGPVALRMVFAYLDEDMGIEKIEEVIGNKEDKGVNTIELALASKKLGFETKLFTKHLGFNEENRNLDFYKKYDNLTNDITSKLISEAREMGVGLEERTLDIDELLGFVSEDSLVIVLLDWNVVKGQTEKKYHGHFVPVIGYDEENVYVHNQGRSDPMPNLAIPLEVFDKARKAEGTDEDFVVVYRKK